MFFIDRISIETATQILKPVFVYIFLEQSSYKHSIAHLLIKIPNKSIFDLVLMYFSFLKVIVLDIHLYSLINFNLVLLWIDK